MALKKHIPTIEDRIQERKDYRFLLKSHMKDVKSIINILEDLDKEIEKLENKSKKSTK